MLRAADGPIDSLDRALGAAHRALDRGHKLLLCEIAGQKEIRHGRGLIWAIFVYTYARLVHRVWYANQRVFAKLRAARTRMEPVKIAQNLLQHQLVGLADQLGGRRNHQLDDRAAAGVVVGRNARQVGIDAQPRAGAEQQVIDVGDNPIELQLGSDHRLALQVA